MAKRPKRLSYQIDLIPDEQGGYTVVVPALAGCISHGKTTAEAARNAREAIELHLENLVAHKEPIPKGHEVAPVLSTLVHIGAGDAR
jgi:antitoxin HicB